MEPTRRLAAILAADIAGYSRLIGADEAGTLGRLRAIRAEVMDLAIAAHNGRLVKTTGDGFLVEYSSVVDALRSASEIQAGMAERNIAVPQDQRIVFRIGLNVGDVVVEDGDILVMASSSQPGSRDWPSRAGSAFLPVFRKMRPGSSIFTSRTSANSN